MPSASHHHRARDRAQAVTTARRSQDEDRGRRMRNYLWAMGVRTACFPLAVWAFATERYALAWVAALAAIIIPSFAVMLANAVDHRRAPVTDEVSSPVQRLGPGPQEPDRGPVARAPDGGDPTDVPGPADAPIQGTVVDRRESAHPPPDTDEDGSS